MAIRSAHACMVEGVTTSQQTCPFGSGFDFTDPDVMLRGVPVAEFAQLRKTAPVWWNEQAHGSTIFDDGGYWVISKHQHIKEISRDNEVWSTNAKGAVMRLPEGVTAEQLKNLSIREISQMTGLGRSTVAKALSGSLDALSRNAKRQLETRLMKLRSENPELTS